MAQTNILLESGTNELEIVEFFIDATDDEGRPFRAYFGVNVAKVLEIIRLPKVTEMPNRPHPAVAGTFNLRSRVIPLIDLSLCLDINMVRSQSAKVIVAEFNRITNAFLVTGVTRIHRLSWQQVEPPGQYVAGLTGNSFTGVVKFEDRIVLIVDMEKIIWDINPNLAMRAEREESEKAIPQPEIPYRALVVDDSGSIRRLIVSYLRRDGFDITEDINGMEAWHRLSAYRDAIQAKGGDIFDYLDLVVTDIEMPAMDGHNLCKRIKDDPLLMNLPVVLFSSLINEKLLHKGEAVGADDQVTKPEIATLTERAHKLIEGRRAARKRKK